MEAPDRPVLVLVLVSDLVMREGMSGKELAGRLRNRWPDLRVILMSGYSGELAGHSMTAQDECEFLQKTFSAAQLAHAIQASARPARENF